MTCHKKLCSRPPPPSGRGGARSALRVPSRVDDPLPEYEKSFKKSLWVILKNSIFEKLKYSDPKKIHNSKPYISVTEHLRRPKLYTFFQKNFQVSWAKNNMIFGLSVKSCLADPPPPPRGRYCTIGFPPLRGGYRTIGLSPLPRGGG